MSRRRSPSISSNSDDDRRERKRDSRNRKRDRSVAASKSPSPRRPSPNRSPNRWPHDRFDKNGDSHRRSRSRSPYFEGKDRFGGRGGQFDSRDERKKHEDLMMRRRRERVEIAAEGVGRLWNSSPKPEDDEFERKRHASDQSDDQKEKRKSKKDKKKAKKSKDKKKKKKRTKAESSDDGEASSEEAEWVEVTKETVGKTAAADDEDDDNIVGPSLKQSEAYQREQDLRVDSMKRKRIQKMASVEVENGANQSSELDEGRFIDEVSKHPWLWNASRLDYKSRQKKLRSWTAIGEIFGLTVKEAKAQWKVSRAHFNREKKKLIRPSGDEGGYESKWEYFDKISFVDGSGLERSSISNIPSQTLGVSQSRANGGSDDENEDEADNGNGEDGVFENGHDHGDTTAGGESATIPKSIVSPTSNLPTKDKASRKRVKDSEEANLIASMTGVATAIESLSKARMATLTSTEPASTQDGHYHFGQFVASKLRRLDEVAASAIQHGIMDILHYSEIGRQWGVYEMGQVAPMESSQ